MSANLPKRRKHVRTKPDESGRVRSPGHRAWVRGFVCSASMFTECGHFGPVQAAHVRTGTDGALGIKPSDCYVIALCSEHHAEQHRIGERAFEHKYGLDMLGLAADLWRRSPHRLRWQAKQSERT